MPKKKKIVNKPPDPIVNKEDIQYGNDAKIDQDFPGYPHHPSKEDIINGKKDITNKKNKKII